MAEQTPSGRRTPTKRSRWIGTLVLVAAVIAVAVAVLTRRPINTSDPAVFGPTDVGSASTAASANSAPAPATSQATSLAVVVSDNPAFDLTGSGDACRMHYFQDSNGDTVTLFDLTADGQLITHVSGPDGIGRHDEQMTRGVGRIVYDFPLSQATDMGAVLYLADGSSQSCTISAGSDMP